MPSSQALVYTQPTADLLVSTSVDYLTITGPSDSHATSARILARNLLDTEILRGCEERESRWKGYRTLAAGSCLFGDREDGWLVRISGHLAAEHWHTLHPIASHVTRLDLQCTGRYLRPRLDLARRTFAGLPSVVPGRRDYRKVCVRAYKAYGDTLTLGSRVSAAHGRNYDKSAEQGEAQKGRDWRWECELKQDLALQTLNSLAGTADPSVFISRTVYSWFLRWRIRPGFPVRSDR